jgi:arylsulfatase A-like enzyme
MRTCYGYTYQVAHEHFMLRLPSLDEHLATLLRRMARGALQDTVLLLLSDHGTHGIWCAPRVMHT